jgi:hypothetical protein
MGGGGCPLLSRMPHATPKHCSSGEQPLNACHSGHALPNLCPLLLAPSIADTIHSPAASIIALQTLCNPAVACHYTAPLHPLDALPLGTSNLRPTANSIYAIQLSSTHPASIILPIMCQPACTLACYQLRPISSEPADCQCLPGPSSRQSCLQLTVATQLDTLLILQRNNFVFVINRLCYPLTAYPSPMHVTCTARQLICSTPRWQRHVPGPPPQPTVPACPPNHTTTLLIARTAMSPASSASFPQTNSPPPQADLYTFRYM